MGGRPRRPRRRSADRLDLVAALTRRGRTTIYRHLPLGQDLGDA
ncbi:MULTISPECIES: hypothetical protein [unclassified Frankia]